MMLPNNNRQVETKISRYIQKVSIGVDWGTTKGIWHVSQISSFTAIHFDEGGKQILKGVPWIQAKFVLGFWWDLWSLGGGPPPPKNQAVYQH